MGTAFWIRVLQATGGDSAVLSRIPHLTSAPAVVVRCMNAIGPISLVQIHVSWILHPQHPFWGIPVSIGVDLYWIPVLV